MVGGILRWSPKFPPSPSYSNNNPGAAVKGFCRLNWGPKPVNFKKERHYPEWDWPNQLIRRGLIRTWALSWEKDPKLENDCHEGDSPLLLWRWMGSRCREGGWLGGAESGPHLTPAKKWRPQSYSFKDLNLTGNRERSPWKKLSLAMTFISVM